MMKNNKYILGTIAALLLGMGSANADPIFSLEPADQDAAPTDVVSVDLVASALPADGIGAFDVDITYDPGALSFLGYTLGSTLGGVGLCGDPTDAWDCSFGDLGGGVVNLAELSFLATVDLLALQGGGPIVLATLDFMVDVLAPGDSTLLGIFGWSISSGEADELLGSTVFAGAAIHNPDASVPEPTTLTLFGLGLLLLRRRVKA
jgi:hypothetical protein